MQMKTLFRHISELSCFLVLFACHEVYLDRPQPIDAKDLSGFPAKLRVHAIDKEGDSAIFNAKGFDFYHTNSFKIAVDKLDSLGLVMNDGQLTSRHPNSTQYGYEFVGGGKELKINELSVSKYGLSDSVKLRKAGKNYFLNVRVDSLWVIYLIEPTRSQINYRLLKEDDLKGVNSVVKMGEAGEDRWFKGTMKKRDIDNLVKKGGFSDTISVVHLMK